MSPKRVLFSGMTAERMSNRAEMLHSLWGIFFVPFDEKLDRAGSGHGAMTSSSSVAQPPTDVSTKLCSNKLAPIGRNGNIRYV